MNRKHVVLGLIVGLLLLLAYALLAFNPGREPGARGIIAPDKHLAIRPRVIADTKTDVPDLAKVPRENVPVAKLDEKPQTNVAPPAKPTPPVEEPPKAEEIVIVSPSADLSSQVASVSSFRCRTKPEVPGLTWSINHLPADQAEVTRPAGSNDEIEVRWLAAGTFAFELTALAPDGRSATRVIEAEIAQCPTLFGAKIGMKALITFFFAGEPEYFQAERISTEVDASFSNFIEWNEFDLWVGGCGPAESSKPLPLWGADMPSTPENIASAKKWLSTNLAGPANSVSLGALLEQVVKSAPANLETLVLVVSGSTVDRGDCLEQITHLPRLWQKFSHCRLQVVYLGKDAATASNLRALAKVVSGEFLNP